MSGFYPDFFIYVKNHESSTVVEVFYEEYD